MSLMSYPLLDKKLNQAVKILDIFVDYVNYGCEDIDTNVWNGIAFYLNKVLREIKDQSHLANEMYVKFKYYNQYRLGVK